MEMSTSAETYIIIKIKREDAVKVWDAIQDQNADSEVLKEFNEILGSEL
jgi:hypothetical protein